MSGGTNRSWVDLPSQKEAGAVGSELVPEGAEEENELKLLNAFSRLCELVVESGSDEEEDEVGKKAVGLHPLATIHLVVDEKGSQVVASERDRDVDEIVPPGGHDAGRSCCDADEHTSKDLVTLEEEVVAEPRACSAQDEMPIMSHGLAE